MSPQHPLPRLPARDTYGRARGSLSSSFSIFASRTLWGENKGLRVGEEAGGQGQSRPPRGAPAALVRGCGLLYPFCREGMCHKQGQ